MNYRTIRLSDRRITAAIECLKSQLRSDRWVIGGSVAAKWHGLDVNPRDIDVFGSTSTVLQAAHCLGDWMIVSPHTRTSRMARSRYAVAVVKGVRVDFVGDLRFASAPRKVIVGEPSLPAVLGSTRVRLMTLDLLLDVYLGLGRLDRASQLLEIRNRVGACTS